MTEHDDRLGAVRRSIGYRETDDGLEIDAPVIDFRDLRPVGRSSDDRRVAPRREGERALHYAEQILLSQACAYVDLLLDPAVDDGDEALLNSVADLARAVLSFREAADKVNHRG